MRPTIKSHADYGPLRALKRTGLATVCSAALVTGVLATSASASPPQSEPRTVSHIDGFTPTHSAKELVAENAAMKAMSPKRVDDNVRYLSKYPGEDATPEIQRRIQYIKEKLHAAGMEVEARTFYPYMADSQKVKVSLEMVSPHRQTLPVKEKKQPWQKEFDKASVGFNEGTPPADLTREVVYVNFGRAVDYDYLADQHISVRNKIVLVRYGGSQRSEVPYQAYVHYAAGVILYSDPQQDGYTRGTVYPNGPWRAPDGIQRGTVYRWTLYPGDPLTPGYAATKNAPRIPVSKSSMGKIPPTTPIGYGAATPLLKNLGGPVAPASWQGTLPFTYHIGGGPTKVHLKIDIQYKPRPSTDIIGTIRGSGSPDKWAVLDAHYDTWAYGAWDNQSGAATALELARSLGELHRNGWKPERSIKIIFTSAEERGITGSTEWTEWLGKKKMAGMVAEITNDANVGSQFGGNGTPSLHDLLLDVTKRVPWPGTSGSAYDNWGHGETPTVGVPGGGVDLMTYRSHFGVPVAGVGGSIPGDRYHCTCDDYRSLKKFMDPELKYTTAAGKVDALLLMRLADADALPLNYSTYAETMGSYLKAFEGSEQMKFGYVPISVARNQATAQEWASAASALESQRRERLGNGETNFGAMNNALMEMSRAMLTEKGLPGRPWFKNQFAGAQFHNGFALQPLPGLYDALITFGDQAQALEYEGLLHDSLENALSITKAAH